MLDFALSEGVLQAPSARVWVGQKCTSQSSSMRFTLAFTQPKIRPSQSKMHAWRAGICSAGDAPYLLHMCCPKQQAMQLPHGTPCTVVSCLPKVTQTPPPSDFQGIPTWLLMPGDRLWLLLSSCRGSCLARSGSPSPMLFRSSGATS